MLRRAAQLLMLFACDVQAVQLEVLGMHCSACSSAVEASLGEMPGVLHSSISLILRKAIVRIDPSLVSHVSESGAAHRLGLVQWHAPPSSKALALGLKSARTFRC